MLVNSDVHIKGRFFSAAIIGFVILGLCLIIYFMPMSNSRFATINLPELMREKITTLAKQSNTEQATANEVERYVTMLENEIQTYSKRHHLILLPKEAVLAGASDHTQAVQRWLDKKIKSRDV